MTVQYFFEKNIGMKKIITGVSIGVALFVAALCVKTFTPGLAEKLPEPKPDISIPVAETPQPVRLSALKQNPLVLSVPVSAGKMEMTFASWSDYEVAKRKAGL